MTPEQRVLLEDKLALWRQASTQGNMEMRDYNRRCADALEAALQSTPPDRGAQSEMREAIRRVFVDWAEEMGKWITDPHPETGTWKYEGEVPVDNLVAARSSATGAETAPGEEG